MGSGYKVWGLKLFVGGLRLGIWGLGSSCEICWSWGLCSSNEVRVYGLRFRVWCLGFRVEGLGFRIWELGNTHW